MAVEAEGLLRGSASLLQLIGPKGQEARLACVTVTDWPNFRSRCASDWLLNVEVNRWAYDWGDGPTKYLERIKRKLDLCFLYKINQVWFDGFGWNAERFPGYAAMMREYTRYARQRGIRLVFAGYGGGYGTSYQQSELYRYGYFGETFLNRRSYPDGPQYFCRGMERVEISRVYGTCLSNEGLAQAKLAELKRFVAEVEPGCLYIHDIDTGHYAASRAAWQLRCDECRRRWPSDDIESPEGQAAAMAAWYAKIRDALLTPALPMVGERPREPRIADVSAGIRGEERPLAAPESIEPIGQAGVYQAKRDLTLVFVSPLYASLSEKSPDLWRREVEYFRTLSRLMGTSPNVQFGVRELFYSAGGGRKLSELRTALDTVGNGHTPYVISFGGGDNYLSDDLVNYSGAMAHFFAGAASVCLSNGAVHEEPVQVLNAELLWSGAARGHREQPPDEQAALDLWSRMKAGRYRPAAVFGPGALFEQICRRLWGDAAGVEMYRAYMAGGESSDGPVCRVWFSVTRDVRQIQSGTPPKNMRWQDLHARWVRRLAATREALEHARRAAELTSDEDVAWLARSLDVGRRFGELVVTATALRAEPDPAARQQLLAAIADLESYLRREFRFDKTDPLGGDPGCWMETVEYLKKGCL